jgi:hypothetical protein
MVELAVATAILAVVFAAIMPVFAAIRRHADTAGAGSEMVQSARVLNEQLYRHLAQARRITAMSDGSATDGYIEFETRDAVTRRCQLGSGGFIEFGPVDELSELAGPAEHLTFTCYDGNDPAVPTDVPSHVRLVTWEARLESTGATAADKIIRGGCYLRVGAGAGSEETRTAYDFATGRQGVDCFAFSGSGRPRVPTGPGTPSSPLSAAQYDAIEVQDEALHEVSVSDEADYAQIRFMFQIQENRGDVSRITATWRGKGVNAHSSRTDGASLYVWNYASANYELLQASADTEAEVTLTGSRSETPARYMGGAGDKTVVLLAVSNDKKTGNKSDILYTDYVRADVIAASALIVP